MDTPDTTDHLADPQPLVRKRVGEMFFAFTVCGALLGSVGLVGGLSGGWRPSLLIDTLAIALFALGTIACRRLLLAGKLFVVALWTAMAVASTIYTVAVGKGVSVSFVLFVLLAVALLSLLIVLWRRGELV